MRVQSSDALHHSSKRMPNFSLLLGPGKWLMDFLTGKISTTSTNAKLQRDPKNITDNCSETYDDDNDIDGYSI